MLFQQNSNFLNCVPLQNYCYFLCGLLSKQSFKTLIDLILVDDAFFLQILKSTIFKILHKKKAIASCLRF